MLRDMDGQDLSPLTRASDVAEDPSYDVAGAAAADEDAADEDETVAELGDRLAANDARAAASASNDSARHAEYALASSPA